MNHKDTKAQREKKKTLEPRGSRVNTGEEEIFSEQGEDFIPPDGYEDFDEPELEITENGCAIHDGPDQNGLVQDTRRTDFIRDYLVAVARAIEDGAKVRSYHVRSLLDGFEWSEGFSQRFGLVAVDLETGDRRLKESGKWYGEVADRGGFKI